MLQLFKTGQTEVTLKLMNLTAFIIASPEGLPLPIIQAIQENWYKHVYPPPAKGRDGSMEEEGTIRNKKESGSLWLVERTHLCLKTVSIKADSSSFSSVSLTFSWHVSSLVRVLKSRLFSSLSNLYGKNKSKSHLQSLLEITRHLYVKGSELEVKKILLEC